MSDAATLALVFSRAFEIVAAELADPAPDASAPTEAGAPVEPAQEPQEPQEPQEDPEALRGATLQALIAYGQAHGRADTLAALQEVVPGANKIHDVPDDRLAALRDRLTPVEAAA